MLYLDNFGSEMADILQNLKKEIRVSKISLILWRKTNAEVVWLLPIRSVSSKEKLNRFRLLRECERIQS